MGDCYGCSTGLFFGNPLFLAESPAQYSQVFSTATAKQPSVIHFTSAHKPWCLPCLLLLQRTTIPQSLTTNVQPGVSVIQGQEYYREEKNRDCPAIDE